MKEVIAGIEKVLKWYIPGLCLKRSVLQEAGRKIKQRSVKHTTNDQPIRPVPVRGNPF